MTTSSSSIPLGKYLASTEKKTRDKAIKSLSIFLSEAGEDAISKLEMDKLWKGIFYCFWMSDKPLVQQALASELAELLLTISSNAASLAFLEGFWVTIVREWNGIDRLRVDKYYMLVRRFVNASFRLLLRAEWDRTICTRYNNILTNKGGPLCPTDVKVPTSLSTHLADVYLEELNKVLQNAPLQDDSPPVPLVLISDPLFVLSAQVTSKVTFQRLKSSFFEPLLSALSSPEEDEDDEPPRKRARMEAEPPALAFLPLNSCLRDSSAEGKLDGITLRKQIGRALFEIASRPETRDPNRRKLYALWKDETAGSDDD